MLAAGPSELDDEDFEAAWYWRIARAAVAAACLDYIALHFPEDAKARLTAWARDDVRHQAARFPETWAEERIRTLREWFEGEGCELAQMVDALPLIEKTRHIAEGRDRDAALPLWDKKERKARYGN